MDEEQELILLCSELLEPPAQLQQEDEQKINLVIACLREHLSVRPQLEMLVQLAGNPHPYASQARSGHDKFPVP